VYRLDSLCALSERSEVVPERERGGWLVGLERSDSRWSCPNVVRVRLRDQAPQEPGIVRGEAARKFFWGLVPGKTRSV
jgi:hypothetical protein